MENVVASNEAPAQANAEAQEQENVAASETASEVNARLLAESKKNKKLAQEYKAKLDQAEKTTMEQQAKYKELYEKERLQRESLFKAVVKEKVKSTVATHAAKAGCVSVDDLIKLGNAELLQVDEDTLEVQGADLFVEDAKKAKPWLFTAVKSSINPANPGGVIQSNSKQLKDLSKDEIMAKLKALG